MMPGTPTSSVLIQAMLTSFFLFLPVLAAGQAPQSLALGSGPGQTLFGPL